MTNEKQFFLQILRDFLRKAKTEAPENVDWGKILSCASQHQVEGIVYYQCKNLLPKELAARSAQLYAFNLFYYSNRRRCFSEIRQQFSRAEIPFYTVKGLNVAPFYPVPALRTMGDCDMVVHTEDKEKAHEVMLALGYQNRSQQNNEWTYFKTEMEFELHDHLLYEEIFNSPLSVAMMDRAWEYAKKVDDSYAYELDWNFHFVFLLLHLKKHLLYSGAGFRQFMDIAVTVQNAPLDWSVLTEMLAQVELLEFAKVCCTFCQRWFGLEMPLSAELEEAFYEEATEKIFGNGLFGFDDETNLDNANLNQLQHKGKLRTMLGRMFPAYRDMVTVPHYAFLEGKPWLLPFAWVYRLVRSLRYGKGADGVKMLDAALNSDEKLKKRNTMLEQWGM